MKLSDHIIKICIAFIDTQNGNITIPKNLCDYTNICNSYTATYSSDPLIPVTPTTRNTQLHFKLHGADLIYFVPLHDGNRTRTFMLKSYYDQIKNTKIYRKYPDKIVVHTAGDETGFLYDNTPIIKIVCQPAFGESMNIKHNVIPAPLLNMSTKHFHVGETLSSLTKNTGYHIITNDILSELRNQPKKYTFGYIGQTTYAGRQWIEGAEIDDMLFKSTTETISRRINPKRMSLRLQSDTLTDINVSESMQNNFMKRKRKLFLDYLRQLSQCKYSLCPRGKGSSSYRIYESLSVGSIPIIFGSNALPFTDTIDWTRFAIIRPQIQSNDCIKRACEQAVGSSISHTSCSKLWDENFDLYESNNKLLDILCKKIRY